MKYKINEIFRSVQAEGRNAGRSAVFVRFAGCNLKCDFCDTKHEPFIEMTEGEIDARVESLTNGDKNVLIVFTGGEPTMQLSESIELCKGYCRAIETNGILPAPSWIDWVTISPKTPLKVTQLARADEIKLLYGVWSEDAISSFSYLNAELYIQPLERNSKMNTEECLAFIEKNPKFKISIQLHKIIGIK